MAKLLLSVLFIVLVAVPVAGAHDAEPSQPGWAVLVVDVQPCFVTGGTLAVAGADAAYVSYVQRATEWLYQKGFLILGSRDYHPSNHISFASNHPGYKPFDVITLPDGRVQVLWPDHCVQTVGDSRELVDNNLFIELIKKGQDWRYDSYSAFRDDGGANTELHPILHARGVTHLVVYGIATDYCVKASVMDALELGYSVVVVEDLIRGVAPDTSAKAIADMKAAGAVFVPSVKALEKHHRK
jgi:nicotinamidase/pyrazinamidase